MAFFILIFLFFRPLELYGSRSSEDQIEIFPPSIYNSASFRVDETLNYTCFISNDLPGDVHLEWIMPSKTVNSQNKVDFQPGSHSLNMVIRNLQENDSGEYKCTASSNTNPDLMLQKSIRINIKQRKNSCNDMMFQCGIDKCIHKRYLCDGKKDCKAGEDEAETLCGAAPCKNKISCHDGRCIPSSWCCDPSYSNCTSRLPCCPFYFPDDGSYTQENHRYNDVAFFQTTVYTVIGCAMAFMFIVTILVIAICRVHMRRTMMPRCSAANRSLNYRPGSHFDGLFYDLDVLFNRPNDSMSVNPLLVTYNINNGVQFVGRPVDPPPYCEIVATPPREGPPPPYISNENLAIARSTSKTDVTENEVDEPDESDSLLPSQTAISVISNNNIDSDEPVTSTFVVNLTESEQGGSPMLIVVETQIMPDSSHTQTTTLPVNPCNPTD